MNTQAKKLKRIFAVIMILSGLAVFSYPFISNWFAQRNASYAIQEMQTVIEEMDKSQIDAIKEAAKQYNAQLSSISLRDEAQEGVTAAESYVDFLGVGEAMGYISIPSIDVELPIYEGTTEAVLLKGVGHMTESSYPLGGLDTHSVLTGHRGLASAVLFTNLDRMEPGDLFFLHVLDEELAYRVDEITVILPEETDSLAIIPGGDYCTLVTCTPLGINSHRLLVRGVRTDNVKEEERLSTVQYQSLRTGNIVRRFTQLWPWMVFTAAEVIGVEALLLLALLAHQRRRMEDD